MQSKGVSEGYLEIDHRDSPGLSEGLAHRVGMDGLPVGKGQVLKTATITCSHCQRVLILNPLRTRERAWCSKCDGYICDWCAAALHQTGVCRSFEQITDEFMDAAAKGKPLVINPSNPTGA